MKPQYKAGDNIAIKVPPHEYEKTVSFYRVINDNFIFPRRRQVHLTAYHCIKSIDQVDLFGKVFDDR
jgi:hypothetical protein